MNPSAKRIWHLVVAAVLWSVWLARNELIFSTEKVKKEGLNSINIYSGIKMGGSLGTARVWRHSSLEGTSAGGNSVTYFQPKDKFLEI